jgi:hypothetical protein|tara:strand:- start:168 stop:371 length:204 start_codon:yes stop_codon:yes gene_type:complete
MKITRQSMFSGQVNSMNINVTNAQIEAWQGGVLIQTAMPDLSPDQREFIMTGVTPQEWEETFSQIAV